MPDLADINEAIAQAAIDPQRVAVDGQLVDAKPVGDQIKAAHYFAGTVALSGSSAEGGPRSGWGTLRMAKAVPPGA